MISLRARLLLAASLILVTFLAAGGLAVERSYRVGAEQAQRDKLQGLIYGLLGVAEIGADNHLLISELDLPDPRLRQPLSGLEAVIRDDSGQVIWRSPSFYDELPDIGPMEVGQWQFDRVANPPRFSTRFGLRWMGLDAEARQYTMQVYEDQQAYNLQIARFRTTLWFWLGAAALGMLLSLLMILWWLIRPVRRLAKQLRHIQAGDQDGIEGRYPPELEPLTQALNTMISNERRQLERYRNALGDLAHSLKTPLAVLGGMLEELPADSPRTGMQEQLQRIREIAEHQLQRAATAGRRALAEGSAVAPVAERIVGALRKVHADRQLSFGLTVSESMKVPIESGDLYELLGNLMDNAARLANHQVRLSGHLTDGGIQLLIEDDGPGFPSNPERLLQRGVRADSRNPGQGLGLSAVDEIVRACGGTIQLQVSHDLGGACVRITLPSR